MYIAAIQFSLVEIAPRTNVEMLTVMCCMLLSAIYMAKIFGDFAVLMGSLGDAEAMFQDRVDTANAAMTSLGLT
jgi:hypothetical protein